MLNWFMLRSTHRNEIAEKDKIIAEKDAEITRISNLGRLGGNIRLELLKERDEARAALTDIANMATENCAHIGKRMAGRAREALPGGGPAVRLRPAKLTDSLRSIVDQFDRA